MTAVSAARLCLRALRPARGAGPGGEPGCRAPAGGGTTFVDGPVLVEAVFPFVAQSAESQVTLFVQTSAGRKQAGKADGEPFDITVPGTLKLTARPSAPSAGETAPGYASVSLKDNPTALSPLDDGRFTFNVPIEMAPLPTESLAVEEVEQKAATQPKLAVRGDDTLYFGFRYKDPSGSEKWIVRIEDNGPGIPSGKEDTLFEVFYSGRKGGTGFGLAIARRIMEAHGGSISAENRPEGGARFTLAFPACKAPAAAQEIAGAVTPAAIKGEPETIG